MTDLLVGGWLVDALIQRGYRETVVRETILVGGTIVRLAIACAMFTNNPVVAVFWITIALGGLSAAAPVGRSVPSLIAPRDSVGSVGGILNFADQLAAIVAPILTLQAPQIRFRAFAAAAVILLVGIGAYIILLGRIEPVPEPTRFVAGSL